MSPFINTLSLDIFDNNNHTYDIINRLPYLKSLKLINQRLNFPNKLLKAIQYKSIIKDLKISNFSFDEEGDKDDNYINLL